MDLSYLLVPIYLVEEIFSLVVIISKKKLLLFFVSNQSNFGWKQVRTKTGSVWYVPLMLCNRIGWENLDHINKNSVLGYPVDYWLPKHPNQISDLEFWGSCPVFLVIKNPFIDSVRLHQSLETMTTESKTLKTGANGAY